MATITPRTRALSFVPCTLSISMDVTEVTLGTSVHGFVMTRVVLVDA